MKKRFFSLISVILVCFLSLVGCAQVQSESKNRTIYQTISTETAKKRLDVEKGIILLDVRTMAENTEKRIPGSMLIPVDDIQIQATEKLKDRNAAIFIYCRSGNRSAIAAQALANMGYTNVYDLGGINKWPYETESSAAVAMPPMN